MSQNDFLPLLEAWDGEGVVVRHDRPTGTWLFIALHSSVLGGPTGGTRMKVYPGLRDAMRDVMRLAEGMTHKWAGLGADYGGGKAVLAIHRPLDVDERRGLMRRYGALLETLAGAFKTGADLGTGPRDMADVASVSRYVLGIDPKTGESVDPGPFTARGVLAGIRAAARQRLGRDDLTGLKVVIQGVGGVGDPLARGLSDAGAAVVVSDADPDKASSLAGKLGVVHLPAHRVHTEPCDVFAPCAIGGVLSEETITSLGCKIIAGSANNQLLEEDDADRLAKWGVLYVPDYIVNAGGALAFSLIKEGLTDRASLEQRVDAIGDAVGDILAEAEASQTTPLHTARRRVDRLIAERRRAL